ncbi:cell wall-associated NlpC family hydrolase [Brachybacterium muris]|uniref:C40 family peptidase n=2 Tax=Brachybacterium muris TaxID=219301 RepID=UPI00195ABAD9|nr:NlpC/P60 family protein [Brachybacterium muris]MBM7499820.1 cell wall-associated NlpC family hydrolase [Brachybacterium muris]MCT1653872.1 NlpC/P60 family protein [Brachybacterium muris]
MAKHNTHRAVGRATTPVSNARVAARGMGGAAVLGTVLVGSAFVGGTAQAAPAPAPAAPVTAPAVAPAAPEAAAPTVVLNTTEKLRWGSRGGNVADLQSGLNQNGANIAVDGKFGPRTHAAVKDFQRSNGLLVDGVVGPQTRGALNGGVSMPSSGTSAPAKKSSSASTSSIVERARSVVGTGYTWGGSSPSAGFDCSGLVTYAYQGSGLNLNGRTSSQITNGGRTISQSQAQPGDIVSWPGHIGIYAGNGQVIDASGSKYRVTERGIWGNPTFVTYR